MHNITVNKTIICSELRIEPCTFHSPREGSVMTYLSFAFQWIYHQNTAYIISMCQVAKLVVSRRVPHRGNYNITARGTPRRVPPRCESDS